MCSFALAEDPAARLQMFRQVAAAAVQNGELTPFESGVYGIYCSPRHHPSKYKAHKYTRTAALTRVSQYMLPPPDLEENFVSVLDREKLF